MEIIPKKKEGIGEWREEKFAVIDTGIWECKSCAYEYNESKGDPDFPVAAGTPWKVCGRLWITQARVSFRLGGQ